MTKLFLVAFLAIANQQSCEKEKLTECDHPSGWCKEIRELGAKSWKYAQLSKNVYNSSSQFDVSDYFDRLENFEDKSIDFYGVAFKNIKNGQIILVFRGTDSFKDYKAGTNPFNNRQGQYALHIYDSVKAKYPSSEKMIVVGHSLGGALAINVSLNRESLIAYSFNGSPVFKNEKNYDNERYSIVEYGEVLKLFRIFGREATQSYTSIGCSGGSVVSQHDMEKFAVCLTQIGSISDIEARKSLNKNKIPSWY